MEEFKVGNVVNLKSNPSVKMTVEEVLEETVSCVYFTENPTKLERGSFYFETVELTKQKGVQFI